MKREWGQFFFFLQKNQLRKIFQNLSAREAERFVEAYESIKQIWSVWLLLPMWAIWYLGFLFVYVAMYFTEREGGWCKEIFGKTIFYNMSIRYMYVSISIQNDPCATKMYFYRICEHSGTLSLSMSKWSIKFILIPLNVISIISSLSKWQLGSGELDCMLHYLYIIQRFVVKINGCLIA